MKKFYYLSTCATCKEIMKNLDLENFELQDIKTKPLTAKELEELKMRAGSYEALFSKRAQLYKKYRLKEKKLNEIDFKKYLLEHYTFVKRPILIDESNILIGNSPKIKKALTDGYGKYN